MPVPTIEVSDIQATILRPRPSPYTLVTQLPHLPIVHFLDSPGVIVPDEANLGYLPSPVLGVLLISTGEHCLSSAQHSIKIDSVK